MKTQSQEINPEKEQEYIEYLRKLSSTEKFAIICSLNTAYLQAVREKLRQSHPDTSKQELDILFIEQLYGKELAQRLQNHLNKQTQEHAINLDS